MYTCAHGLAEGAAHHAVARDHEGYGEEACEPFAWSGPAAEAARPVMERALAPRRSLRDDGAAASVVNHLCAERSA